jgi:hypothetical protein
MLVLLGYATVRESVVLTERTSVYWVDLGNSRGRGEWRACWWNERGPSGIQSDRYAGLLFTVGTDLRTRIAIWGRGFCTCLARVSARVPLTHLEYPR